jgi:hypothetical protein
MLRSQAELYAFLAHLAVGLRSQGIALRYSVLQVLLASKGRRYHATRHRGLIHAVTEAQHYWESRNQEWALAIAWAFTDEHDRHYA